MPKREYIEHLTELDWKDENELRYLKSYRDFRKVIKRHDDLYKDPAAILQGFLAARGDIDTFLNAFHPTCDDEKITILSLVLHVLSQPDNAIYKAKWDSLLASFRQAKALFAERQALEFISTYQMPDIEKVPLTEYTAFIRLWLSPHMTTETTRAKKFASQSDSFSQANELEDIIRDLKIASG